MLNVQGSFPCSFRRLCVSRHPVDDADDLRFAGVVDARATNDGNTKM